MKLSTPNSFKSEEVFSFLPAVLEVTESPPNKAASWITWAIVALVAMAIAWACIGKLDVVIVGQGMVKKVEGQGNSNGSYYVIEAHFADKDIGFLEPGIQAKIKVNAYRSNKFGMLNGALGELRFQQSGSQPAGSFVTYIVPNAGYLLYDEKRWELKEGMSVVVDVKVGERNIIDYLLSSIKNKQSEVMREI
jgi:hypothetical protein